MQYNDLMMRDPTLRGEKIKSYTIIRKEQVFRPTHSAATALLQSMTSEQPKIKFINDVDIPPEFYAEKNTIVHQSTNELWLSAITQGNLSFLQDLTQEQTMSRLTTTQSNTNTPLHIAAQEGQIEIIELLLKLGANINHIGENGRTPLHAAVAFKEPKATRTLLENNADITIKDKQGYHPISLAQEKGYQEIVTLLEDFEEALDLLKQVTL